LKTTHIKSKTSRSNPQIAKSAGGSAAYLQAKAAHEARPRAKLSAFAIRELRRLKPGEQLLLIQDIQHVVTRGYSWQKEGWSAFNRLGLAVGLLFVKEGKDAAAIPISVFSEFSCAPGNGWSAEIPAALLNLNAKKIWSSVEYCSTIKAKGFVFKVRIEPTAADILETARVITKSGEDLGPNTPSKVAFRRLRSQARRLANRLLLRSKRQPSSQAKVRALKTAMTVLGVGCSSTGHTVQLGRAS
jgi:hypothetical protein